MNNIQQNQSLKELDIGYFVGRFLNLFWRWRLWIMLTLPVIVVCWVIYLMKFGAIKPELETTSTIVIEDAQEMGVYSQGNQIEVSGIEFIKSRNFLSPIVNQLSLRLMIPDHQRHEIFDSVFIDSIAPPCEFNFLVGKEQKDYQLFSSCKSVGIKNKLVESGDLYKLDTYSQNGVHLKFSENFLKNPFKFYCYVASTRGAVDKLLRNITLEPSAIVKGGPVYVAIKCKGRDYRLIAKTANMIADRFIEMSQGSKTQKSKENIANLEKQLATAAEQLKIAQDSVENFRRRYPNVGLGAEMMSNVGMIASLESGSASNNSWAEEAQRIRSRLASATENDQELYVKEALIFLVGRGNNAAAVLQQEFAQLTGREMQLLDNYDKSHPYVKENNSKIAEVRAKTDALLSEFASSASANSVKQMSQVQSMTSQIKGLPILQARLAELERQAQVTAQIHSNILSRYNQSKIIDVAETDGVSIMDYALEPYPPSDFENMLMKLSLGILIGLAVSFGIPVIADLLDKTARSDRDLSKLLEFTVLESIPEIRKKGNSKGGKKEKKNKPEKGSGGAGGAQRLRTIDEKLITADYTPDFTNELFRSLRAKIMLRMHDVEKKMIIVTSNGMSEGKSLVSSNLAITMAQQQLRTLLIDGDIRRGVLHNSFVLHKKPGLSNFLFAETPVSNESIRELLQTTHVPNLSVISSGVNVPNPSELLSLPRFKALLECLKEMYDVIIFDTPPIGVAADAAIAGTLFSACLIVVRAGITNVIDLRRRLQEYPNLKKKVIGTVLNGAVLDKKMRESKYSMYHY